MSKSISVIVKQEGEIFGLYPSIKAAAIAVEDYFENILNKKRPSLNTGFCAMVRNEWIPDEKSQLYGWSIEKR